MGLVFFFFPPRFSSPLKKLDLRREPFASGLSLEDGPCAALSASDRRPWAILGGSCDDLKSSFQWGTPHIRTSSRAAKSRRSLRDFHFLESSQASPYLLWAPLVLRASSTSCEPRPPGGCGLRGLELLRLHMRCSL